MIDYYPLENSTKNQINSLKSPVYIGYLLIYIFSIIYAVINPF